MSYSEQLTASGTRLRSQGLLFIQQTREAGTVFATETRDASLAFADRMAEATTAFTAALAGSATTLGKACQQEATDWAALSTKTREAYLEALTARARDLETRAQAAQKALEPTELETRVLKATQDVLGDAQKRVEARLTHGKPDKATDRKPRPKARPATEKSGRAPIRNYDQLTAKDVVGRIQRLSGPQATAVLDYERSRKNRATVVRAAKQRVAAG
ncbi:MAG: hypothetical protein AAF997_10970 [Myxococcota bacterium]